MAELWNRSAVLKFGVPNANKIIPEGEGVTIDTRLSVLPNVNPEISFEIEKKIEKQNTAEITVYNLSRDSREIVNKADSDTLFCELSVGYGDDNFLLFKGFIQTGGSLWNGYEWKTVMRAIDGKDAKKENFNKSYKAGTDIRDIFNDVLNTVKDRFESLVPEVKSHITKNGLTLSGTVPMILKKLANLVPDQNLEINIENSVISVKPATSIIDQLSIPVVSFNTGMIGAPKKTEDGLDVVALLRDGISPGRAMEVLSVTGEYDGQYLIQNCKYSGSLRGDKWQVASEVKSLNKFFNSFTRNLDFGNA